MSQCKTCLLPGSVPLFLKLHFEVSLQRVALPHVTLPAQNERHNDMPHFRDEFPEASWKKTGTRYACASLGLCCVAASSLPGFAVFALIWPAEACLSSFGEELLCGSRCNPQFQCKQALPKRENSSDEIFKCFRSAL